VVECPIVIFLSTMDKAKQMMGRQVGGMLAY